MPPISTHSHDFNDTNDDPPTDHTTTTLSSGSSTPRATHERRAGIGPGRQVITEPTTSEEDEPDPAGATPNTTNYKQRTLHRYFTTGPQCGFDEEHHLQVEAEVQTIMEEAEANHLPEQPLCSSINEAELNAAQRKLNAASRTGKDNTPNKALKEESHAWQFLLIALFNAILHLCEYP